MATALKGVTLLDADDPLLALSLLPEYRDRRPPFPFQAAPEPWSSYRDREYLRAAAWVAGCFRRYGFCWDTMEHAAMGLRGLLHMECRPLGRKVRDDEFSLMRIAASRVWFAREAMQAECDGIPLEHAANFCAEEN